MGSKMSLGGVPRVRQSQRSAGQRQTAGRSVRPRSRLGSCRPVRVNWTWLAGGRASIGVRTRWGTSQISPDIRDNRLHVTGRDPEPTAGRRQFVEQDGSQAGKRDLTVDELACLLPGAVGDHRHLHLFEPLRLRVDPFPDLPDYIPGEAGRVSCRVQINEPAPTGRKRWVSKQPIKVVPPHLRSHLVVPDYERAAKLWVAAVRDAHVTHDVLELDTTRCSKQSPPWHPRARRGRRTRAGTVA